MTIREAVEKYGSSWIPCQKGSLPEDILPKDYWNTHEVQSFPVLYGTNAKGREITGWGIRGSWRGKFEWDTQKNSFRAWKLRENMIKNPGE